MSECVYQVEEYYIHYTVSDKEAAEEFVNNCEDLACLDARVEDWFGKTVIAIDGFDSESSANEVVDLIRESGL